MKGYIHGKKKVTIHGQTLIVPSDVVETECNLVPVDPQMRDGSAAVYESHAEAQAALDAHHEDIDASLGDMSRVLKGDTKSKAPYADKGPPELRGLPPDDSTPHSDDHARHLRKAHVDQGGDPKFGGTDLKPQSEGYVLTDHRDDDEATGRIPPASLNAAPGSVSGGLPPAETEVTPPGKTLGEKVHDLLDGGGTKPKHGKKK